ncbi:MAG: hypothetical protein DI534_02920 [Leifsonia xyli]|nr:MAG: hypothetical protein DI534_02920 [Leifsonia xyli]
MTLAPLRGALAVVLLLALAACAPTVEAPPSAGPAASGTPSTSPTPTPSTKTTPQPEVIDESERAAIVEGIEAGNPAAVGPFLADEVTFVMAASECCGAISAADAAGGLLSYTSGSSGWTSPVDKAYLDQVRTSVYYGQYVPLDVIALRAASDGTVVVLGVDGDRIVSILVGHEDVLLT